MPRHRLAQGACRPHWGFRSVFGPHQNRSAGICRRNSATTCSGVASGVSWPALTRRLCTTRRRSYCRSTSFAVLLSGCGAACAATWAFVMVLVPPVLQPPFRAVFGLQNVLYPPIRGIQDVGYAPPPQWPLIYGVYVVLSTWFFTPLNGGLAAHIVVSSCVVYEISGHTTRSPPPTMSLLVSL